MGFEEEASVSWNAKGMGQASVTGLIRRSYYKNYHRAAQREHTIDRFTRIKLKKVISKGQLQAMYSNDV